MSPWKLIVAVFYGLFVVKSLFSRGWYRESLQKLQAGTNVSQIKIASWIQAAWMYGAPSWFLWGFLWAGVIFIAMALRMVMAVYSAEASLRLAKEP